MRAKLLASLGFVLALPLAVAACDKEEAKSTAAATSASAASASAPAATASAPPAPSASAAPSASSPSAPLPKCPAGLTGNAMPPYCLKLPAA